ncbi:MAG: pirin family protein [Actinomycetota bacterium]
MDNDLTDRSITTVYEPEPQPGTGILHPFPTAEIPHLDPFVFLDTGAPRHLGEHEIFVGPHPHRGVQPVSLVFRARIEHRDSLGNHATVTSGGMQWLVAGAGALHEEVLNGDEKGVFHMAQLWVNVAADQKMGPPAHHAVAPDEVPVLTDLAPGVTVRLFAGELDGVSGPAPLGTPVLIAHVMVVSPTSVTIPIPPGWTTGVTVVDGAIDLDGRHGLAAGATAVYADDGDQITIGSTTGGEALVMAGQPIGEPVVMGGGFVMTSDDDIAVAFEDLRAGRFGDLTPSR